MTDDKPSDSDPGFSLPHAIAGAILGAIGWSCTDDVMPLWVWMLVGIVGSVAGGRIFSRS